MFQCRQIQVGSLISCMLLSTKKEKHEKKDPLYFLRPRKLAWMSDFFFELTVLYSGICDLSEQTQKKTTAARYVCETQESEIATKPRIHFSRSIWCISATQSFFSIVTLKFLRHFVLICAAPRSSRLKSTAAAVHPVPVTTLKPVYDSIYTAAHYLFF